jgi:hypothetical protein
MTPYSPAYTLFTFIQYTYSHKEGGKWGEGSYPETREKVRGATINYADRKYQHDGLYFQSINSNKHLPPNPFTGKLFLDDILLWCLYS